MGGKMLGFAGEVACDLVGLLVNPDAVPTHPVARAVVLAVMGALTVAGLAVIYMEDGVIAL